MDNAFRCLEFIISGKHIIRLVYTLSPATGPFEKRATPLAAGGIKSRRDVKGFFSNGPVAGDSVF
jgi:hypothetical protein